MAASTIRPGRRTEDALSHAGGCARRSPFPPAWRRSRPRSISIAEDRRPDARCPPTATTRRACLAERFLKPLGVSDGHAPDPRLCSTAALPATGSSSSRRRANPMPRPLRHRRQSQLPGPRRRRGRRRRQHHHDAATASARSTSAPTSSSAADTKAAERPFRRPVRPCRHPRRGAARRPIRDWRKLSGAIPGPFEAWLVHRGLETLELRFDRMCASAADHRGPPRRVIRRRRR
jgi:hypothetical protein